MSIPCHLYQLFEDYQRQEFAGDSQKGVDESAAEPALRLTRKTMDVVRDLASFGHVQIPQTCLGFLCGSLGTDTKAGDDDVDADEHAWEKGQSDCPQLIQNGVSWGCTKTAKSILEGTVAARIHPVCIGRETIEANHVESVLSAVSIADSKNHQGVAETAANFQHPVGLFAESQWFNDDDKKIFVELSKEVRGVIMHVLEKRKQDSMGQAGFPTDHYPAPGPVRSSSTEVFHGVVKSFKGAFGRIECASLACDVLLHRNDCSQAVKRGDFVTFCLSRNVHGVPKAIEAKVIPQSLS